MVDSESFAAQTIIPRITNNTLKNKKHSEEIHLKNMIIINKQKNTSSDKKGTPVPDSREFSIINNKAKLNLLDAIAMEQAYN